MSPNPERLQYLFQRYLQDTAPPDELREFWMLFGELAEDDPVKKDLWQLWDGLNPEEQREQKDWESMLQRIRKQAIQLENKQASVSKRLPVWRAAAAAILLMAATGAFFLFTGKPQKKIVKVETQQQRFKNDVLPGGNKAMLTLSNGTVIMLNSVHSGEVAQQGNTRILKLSGGQLVYRRQSAIGGRQLARVAAVQYNTLRTPRGGQYQLVLPDGSKVWLNAASSIRYPTSFAEKERKVEITGEAYFEVAKNAGKPFIVKLPPAASGEDQGEVQVLGTHFNINAYDDEPAISTTLLEGGVKVASGNKVQLLLPGQEARMGRNGEVKLIKDAPVEQAIAWKNGKFSFDHTSIYEIMRQMSRWYDVEVDYRDSFDIYLTGSISKNVNASQVFKMLELVGEVEFKIAGSRITVMK